MFKKSAVTYFIYCILASGLLCGPLILDVTLTPRLIGLSLFLALSLSGLIRLKKKHTLFFEPSLGFYAAFTVFVCLSTSWALNSSVALFEAGKQLCFFLSLVLTVYSYNRYPAYFGDRILKISVVIFFIAFFFAVFQASGALSFSREELYNVTGINGHKNLYSSFLFLNLFFLFQGYLKLKNNWRRSALWALILSIALLIILQTKAVYLGLAISLPLFLLLFLTNLRFSFLRTRPSFILSVVLIVVCINLFFIYFLPPVVQKGILSMKASGENLKSLKLEEERLVLWNKSFYIIHKKPLAGCGAGNWQVEMPDATLSGLWRGEDLNYTFQRPHNDFLWIISESGYIGFNLYIIFMVSLLFALLRALPLKTENRVLRRDISLCVAVIVGYLCICFFDFPKERIEHGVWLSLILGYSCYLLKVQGIKTRSFELKKILLYPLLALLLFVFLNSILRYKGEFFTRRLLNHKQSGNPSKVIKAGRSALSYAYSLDPTSVPIHWYTGNAEILSGNYQNAQKDFIQAYRLNPFNRHVLNDLASAYVYNNNVILAKHYYEEAARISPRFDDPKLNLAAIYINAGDYKTADIWLKSILHDSERRSSYQKIVDRVLNK